MMTTETAQLEIMYEISSAVLAAESLESTIGVAVNHIRRLIPCQRVVVLAVGQQQPLKALGVDAVDGLSPNVVPDVYGKMLAEPYLRSGNVGGVEDIAKLPQRSPFQEALSQEGVRSFVIIPLMAKRRLIGTLHLESVQPVAFDPEQVRIAKGIATLLAVSIQQQGLRERMQKEIVYNQEVAAMLRQRTHMLKTRNADLDAFTHTVAHDLKTPLTALIGFSELLKSRHASFSGPELREHLHHISESGRVLMDIIDALLLFAKVQHIENIETEVLEMRPIVMETIERLSPMITEAEAQICLPEKWLPVIGYEPWLKEVWVNYISNAIKYGGRPPKIEIGVLKLSEDIVKYWLRDNGAGLTVQEQGKLFERFERLQRRDVRGHGLGLSLVQRIIDKLGGEVGVESTVGQGSTFYFTLPVGKGDGMD